MADKYCAHGAYTYAATPTWGVPQEGDGTTKDPAAAAATVSIDLSAYTAAAGNTISIGGATLTCVASGATNNQFNAGTGTTLIDNIVTAINRTTNTVTVSAAATGWSTPKVQDAVFARRTGNNLEIMTRAGSATYNSNASWKVLTSGFTGGAQIDQQFSGGSGGCWGWVINDRITGAIWPSAQAKYTHGVAPGNQIAGAQGDGDLVHLRANNVILRGEVGGSGYITFVSLANYLVDDGTIWAGDTGYLKFLHDNTSGTYAFGVYFVRNSTSGAIYFGSRNKDRLIFESNSTSGTSNLFYIGFGSALDYRRVVVDNFTCNNIQGAQIRIGIITNRPGIEVNARRINYIETRNITPPSGGVIAWHNVNLFQRVVVEDIIIDYSSYTGAPFSLYPSAPTYSNSDAVLRNCKVICPVTPTTIGANITTIGVMTSILFENIENASVGSLGGILGSTNFFDAYNHSYGAETQVSRIVHSDIGANRNFRIETPYHVTEWVTGGGFPTLNSYLPSGTQWSYSVLWTPVLHKRKPIDFLRLTKTNNADTNDTITIELLLPPSIASSVDDMDIMVALRYIKATDGTIVTVPLDLSRANGTALTSSTAPWTLNSYTTYAAKKIVITTPSAIKADTEVSATLYFADTTPSGSVERLFINPEMDIA